MRVHIIGHARNNMWVNFSHAWLQLADELYTHRTGSDPWDQQLVAGGNGEGTLFYPGRPDVIGGTTHIPVASMRLKMIRSVVVRVVLLS
eukprot:COSAG05_NODE_6941_length_878_cov_0.870347_1_plen_89_part_00